MIKRLCWNVVDTNQTTQDDVSDSEDDEQVIRKLSEQYKEEALSFNSPSEDHSIASSDSPIQQPYEKKPLSLETKHGTCPSVNSRKGKKRKFSKEEYPTSQVSSTIDSPSSNHTIMGSYKDQGIVLKEKKRKPFSISEDYEIDYHPSKVLTCRFCDHKLLLNEKDVQSHIKSKVSIP
ncbi:uncharacterized protein Gasu_01570 [Galdieria sulphuraria]|uniref:Uncharacterized protein n=1 Tax=Galdieria sulphuraria TaxID=130081 RepID=M2XRD1_GALSU|nr:uncharacterized protein Gasu_01570 [Galdieria sulphuraria]EME32797.1 hypothetical protein Gasu_01570 [Galdieria sulphuraria]|eukprot:XP_005709317.1 hypothetical protein Gasu_01570 [Galdieria sulphuraria]